MIAAGSRNGFAEFASEFYDLFEVGIVFESARDLLDPRLPVRWRKKTLFQISQLLFDFRQPLFNCLLLGHPVVSLMWWHEP